MPDRDLDLWYGAGCTYWTDEWDALASTGEGPLGGIPCCPRCGSVGYEIRRAQWWAGVRQHEADGTRGRSCGLPDCGPTGHPRYEAMIRWARGQCFRTFGVLESAWRASQ